VELRSGVMARIAASSAARSFSSVDTSVPVRFTGWNGSPSMLIPNTRWVASSSPAVCGMGAPSTNPAAAFCSSATTCTVISRDRAVTTCSTNVGEFGFIDSPANRSTSTVDAGPDRCTSRSKVLAGSSPARTIATSSALPQPPGEFAETVSVSRAVLPRSLIVPAATAASWATRTT
jgi:hypothetical protein